MLCATDVAARGLDIDGVAHVVNFDLASTEDEFDSYAHRWVRRQQPLTLHLMCVWWAILKLN